MTTIEQYLQGLFAYTFTAANLNSVLLKRDIESGADQADVSTELKELAQADLYMVLFNIFSQGSQSVTKGNWTRSTGSVNIGVNDRKSFWDAANMIYKKYGETDASYGMKDGTNLW
jgi:hypothetical protein